MDWVDVNDEPHSEIATLIIKGNLMKTTLNEIYKNKPCPSGWKKLLRSLEKTKADDEDLKLSYVLESNGIEDAVWALRCFNYVDYCLFLADIAESVLQIYEARHNSNAPKNAINAVRLYACGKINRKELGDAAKAAAYAAYAADSADSAYAAYAAKAAAYAATAYAAKAAYTAYAADSADYGGDATYSRKAKWEKIEELFIKHFG